MAARKQPATVLRNGNVKATIWENSGLKGSFYTASFSRPYKDVEGNWQNATNFGLHELESLMNVALEAKEWLAARAPRR